MPCQVEAVGLVKQTPKLHKHSLLPDACASVLRRETLRRDKGQCSPHP